MKRSLIRSSDIAGVTLGDLATMSRTELLDAWVGWFTRLQCAAPAVSYSSTPLHGTCRRSSTGVKRLVLGLRSKFQPDALLIEDKGSGTALIQELATAGSPFPIPIDPKGDKEMRMHVQAAKIEAGQIYLPREASWLSEFLLEVLAFPRGRHDDQVDSLSQFLGWVGRPREIFEYEF